jgi:hypothetical protein
MRVYNPGVAAILSFLAPGLGQIYTRHWLWAAFWLIVTPGFWLASGGLLGWPFHFFAAIQASNQALERA